MQCSETSLDCVSDVRRYNKLKFDSVFYAYKLLEGFRLVQTKYFNYVQNGYLARRKIKHNKINIATNHISKENSYI